MMSNVNDSNRYAILQNNIGVECFMAMGDCNSALDHFRQALATEHRILDLSSEDIHHGYVASINNDGPIDHDTLKDQCIKTATTDTVRCYQCEVVDSDPIEFIPYLYLHPFAIKHQATNEKLCHSESFSDEVTSSDPDEMSEYVSAESASMSLMMVFNLALTHHTKDRTSMKASSIYQIAIRFLSYLPPPSDSESLLLRVAFLNNYGVWCYENHEFDSMIMCFEEMMHVIDDACDDDDDDAISTFNVAVKRGIFQNLLTLLK